MILFKRDKLFEQFTPAVQKFKELPLSEGFPKVSGLIRVYQTDWEEVDVLRVATELELKLTRENDKASSYSKIQDKFDVILVYNKNDKSIMIAISKHRNWQARNE